MVSKSDLKKPLSELTKLRREEVLKYRKGEEEERIEVLGQESDRKAMPWVQKDVAAKELQEKNYFYLMIDLLKQHQKKKVAYTRLLSQIFLHFLADEAIPKKYFLDIEANDIGLKAEIKDSKYYGAFKVCGLPSYDFRACRILAIKIGNTIAHLEGYRRITNGGVKLPDEEDLRVYG